jgi:hypothetical protein
VSGIILRDPDAVVDRLMDLGWSVDELQDVVDAMVSARKDCTENDPPSAPGWMAWKSGTRRLREIGAEKGWEREVLDGVSWTRDMQRGIRIAVCNTNEHTAVFGGIPQHRVNRSRPATSKAVSCNQASFFDSILPSGIVPLSRIGPQPHRVVNWYLCVYDDGATVRAELSCPSSSDDGRFTSFYEQIHLPLADAGSASVEVFARSPDGPSNEFDITVTRK